MAGYVQAKEEKQDSGRRKLHHLRVHVNDGGGEGHMITHHYGEEEPAHKTHHFSDGEAAMSHIAKHAKFHPPKDESETVKKMEVEEGEEEE